MADVAEAEQAAKKPRVQASQNGGENGKPMIGKEGEPKAILDRAAYFERARAARLRTNPEEPLIYAMYSSLVDGIVTDPELMVVPLDDHAFVRGHAVFDTATLYQGRVYRLGIHLDRLFASARAAKLRLPFGPSEAENRARITDIVCQTCVASGQQTGMVRYYLTGGPGSFGITSAACEPAFYCLIYANIVSADDGPNLVEEATVPEDEVPMKPTILAELKSNNYMLNCLTAMKAEEKGGHQGIGVRTDGTVSESAVSNCMLVTPAKELLTPHFEGILRGTTARKALELAALHLVGEGKPLNAARQERVTVDMLKSAVEVILTGGDTHMASVAKLDGHQIGDGKVGPVAKKLLKLIVEDAAQGDADHIVLKY